VDAATRYIQTIYMALVALSVGMDYPCPG
jgi:hypothetical protein